MDKDIFSDDFMKSSDEKAGGVLAKKDLNEERHNMKKTDEDVFQDFLHNVNHPFMSVLRREAAKYAESGLAFILRNRINVMTDDHGSDEYALYYNNGDVWRQAGEALIWKYLKELYPKLYTPRMKFGCKGERRMLEVYPDNFEWVRNVYRERANKKNGDD